MKSTSKRNAYATNRGGMIKSHMTPDTEKVKNGRTVSRSDLRDKKNNK